MRACLFRRLPLGVAAAVTGDERRKREGELVGRGWGDFDRLRVHTVALQVFGSWMKRHPTSRVGNFLAWQKARSSTEVASFDAVLGRGWIGRAWTFQEIILASNPVIVCGNHSLTWDELVSTIYTHRDYEYTAPNSETSPALLEHWLSIVELWLSLPRPYHANNMPVERKKGKNVPEKEEAVELLQHKQQLAPSFREHLDHLRKTKNYSPWQLRVLHALFTLALIILIFAPYGYLTYLSGTRIAPRISAVLPGNHWRAILGKVFIWISYVFAWLLVSWGTYSLFGNFFNLLDITFFGRGALREFPNIRFPQLNPGNPQELLWRGMLIALRERQCYDPHDKAFSLFGVLKVCGAQLSMPGGVPDYKLPVDETYRILWKDFFTWQPRGLGVLIFAGTKFPWYHGQPEGAPTVGASWALPWGFDMNQGPQWLVNRCGYAFDAFYDQYVEAGPLAVELLGPSHTRLKLKGQRIGTVVFGTQFRWMEPLDKLRLETLAQGGDMSRLVKLWKWRRVLREMNVDQEEAWASLLSDLLARRFKFREFRELCEILDQYQDLIPPSSSNLGSVVLSGQDGEGGTTDNEESWTELLHDVKAYLDPCLQMLLNEDRGLFIASTKASDGKPTSTSDSEGINTSISSGTAGTGPVDIQIGDVVFVLAGVPVPMVLRPVPCSDTAQTGEQEEAVYRIIGPAIVPRIVSGGPKALMDGNTGGMLVPLPGEGERKFEDVVMA
ncbi:hypothetical protein B0T20DRAFT_449794 [Sordaria brevicollis]|uniref:Heterokaryon incompatibility domain-containing protein n=1 Tax=Sordaria brevicollis TaxID=83679 RepID=A0AAE0PMK2_SORBR|nr:hypothetical protein B0T20DRAFT_449794 [Sordaria brevicollis]